MKKKKEPFDSSELYRLDKIANLKNPYMIMLVEILKEIHEIKELLKKNNVPQGTDNTLKHIVEGMHDGIKEAIRGTSQDTAISDLDLRYLTEESEKAVISAFAGHKPLEQK